MIGPRFCVTCRVTRVTDSDYSDVAPRLFSSVTSTALQLTLIHRV